MDFHFEKGESVIPTEGRDESVNGMEHLQLGSLH
jgi:hypothetical protein